MSAPSLPFDHRLSFPATATTGRVRIVAQRREPGPRDQVWSCEESVELILQAIEGQVLNDLAGTRPGRCSARQMTKDDRRVSFELEVEAVPVLTWLVLLGLFTQGHHGGEPLEAVTLDTGAGDVSVTLAQALQGLPPPTEMPAFGRQAFEVAVPPEWGDGPNSATYRFGRPLTPDEFADLRQRLDVWMGLAHLGGFLLDFGAQDDFNPDFGRVHQQTRTRCDALWNDFEGWALAFCGPLNIAAALHREGVPVSSLTLV